MHPKPLVVVVAALCANLPAQLATFTTSAAGCPTPNAPTLSIVGGPVIGTTPVVVANGLPADSLLAFAFLGLTQANIPLDFLDATGCFALAGAELGIPLMALSVPTATLPIAIPNSTSHLGLVLEVQTGALAPSANPFGLATSDRGTLVVGSERLLRSASGYPDPQWTSGAQLLPIWQSGPSSYEMSAMPLTTGATPATITVLKAIVSDAGDGHMSSADFANTSWTINVFAADSQYGTAMAAFDADARNGNYVDNGTLTQTHVAFGSDSWTTFTPASPIFLAPNTEYWVSIRGNRINPLPGSQSCIRHSSFDMQMPTDWYRGNTLSVTPYTQFGLVPGVAAIDIFGF